jgi:hypothetical protein
MHTILSGGGWKRNLAARGDFFLLLGVKPPESFSTFVGHEPFRVIKPEPRGQLTTIGGLKMCFLTANR